MTPPDTCKDCRFWKLVVNNVFNTAGGLCCVQPQLVQRGPDLPACMYGQPAREGQKGKRT